MSRSIDRGGPRIGVVTGATGGLGREIARGLVRDGMTVILGVRDARKGEMVQAELGREPGGGRIDILPLDLASMASARQFAASVAERHSSVNLLVNNAGAWFNERRLSPDGHEMTLATNMLGPYVLTRSLLPLLRAGAPSRIINIVSAATGGYDVDDLEWKRRRYNGFKAYTQSKQALRFMTWMLGRELEGAGVVANAVSPGFVASGFLDNATGVIAMMLRLLRPFAVSPQKAASTPLWVALAPEWESRTGKYVENHREKDRGRSDQADLDALGQWLRQTAE
ncbi:SDR family NAD(P)-dependent oxidoreductase [Pleomorphomonas sp. PLEO]|uniref:SDR family NAD(P)-dependent oxidoreductase n=1 Tax=Pleomorphomonas sp. PLEO TaxID=3239306 RepID=UPI00351F4301